MDGHKRILARILLVAILSTTIEGQWSQRKTAILEGDITIGYLFSMHEQPDQKSAHMRTCGRIWEEYGLQRAEATFQTIERINADPSILPGIRLGVEIRDDCWYAPVALEQTLEFIRDAVASPIGATAAPGVLKIPPTAVAVVPPLAQNQQQLNQCSVTNNNNGSSSAQCPKRRKVLVGVIGPGSSAVSIQVQNLLQLFHIPQIGYSATSRDLSDKNRFRYFLRVVPPDELQARAMLEILQKYNWTYVSAVATEGSYGQSGMQVFREYADREGICIAKEYSILSNDEDEEYDRLLSRILEEPKARIIVCFCEGETVNAILKGIRRFNRTGHFLLVGSDGWADRLDVVEGYEAEAEGGISIRIHSPPVASFDRDYFALKPDKATLARNPWFQEFWEHRFDCVLADPRSPPPGAIVGSGANSLPRRISDLAGPAGNTSPKYCTGEESLQDKYKQDTKMGFIIKASYAMAWALHRLQQSVCGAGSSGLCPAMLPIDGSLLRDHLMNVSFTYGNETVQFDSNGNPPGWYDIMNYQQRAKGTYGYVQIGSWKNGTLDMPDWPAKMVTSVCSEPCQNGQIKIIQKELGCCWQCVPCEPHQRVLNETACQDCQWGYWPDLNTNECREIAAEFGKWSDSQSIVAVTLSVVGLLATTATAAVFACHNDTPVVKASTRELTYIILVGMALCYLTTFPLLAVPSRINCTLSRILPGFSFSLIFASLLTKTNRIARILAGSKKRIRTRKSRWLSLTAQILITMTLIGIEVVLIVSMLVLEPADAVKFFPSRSRVLIICNTTTRGLIAPLGFDFFLIGMCTVYAVKTRNLPENFNEAKFIGFAMYTTCVIWVAFVPIYFSGNESKTITLCMCVSLSAVVTLVLLFGPKLYIIIFKPEKNNRSAFTTTADLRIHIVGGTMKYNANQSSAFSSTSNHANNQSAHRSSSIRHEQSWNGGRDGSGISRLAHQANHRTHQEYDAGKSLVLAASQLNHVVDKGRSNLTFLKRAFGSQLDLATDATSPGSKKGSSSHEHDATTNQRSIKVQTDMTLIARDRDDRFTGRAADGSPSRWQQHRRWASITERRVADEEDAADIIISLGASLPGLGGGCGDPTSPSPLVDYRSTVYDSVTSTTLAADELMENEAYYRLQSLGITVSKCGSADIL